MQSSIVRYIGEQSIATICCVDPEGHPHCFNCYYTFNEEQQQLYFKSQEGSLHSQLLHSNPFVAGTILPDRLNKLMTQGVQFQGKASWEDPLHPNQANHLYHKHLPIAMAKAGHVWTIQLNSVKLTENSLGFAKKVTWEREPVGVST